MDLDKLSISGELISKAIVGMKTRALAYSRQGRDNCIFIGLDGERLSAADTRSGNFMEGAAICSYRNGSEARYGKGNIDDVNLIGWTLA